MTSHLNFYLNFFRKHLYFLIGWTGLVVATVGLVTLCGMPRRYQAITSLLVGSVKTDSLTTSLLGKASALIGPVVGVRTSEATFMDILVSRRVMERIAQRFDLVRFYEVEDMEEALEALRKDTKVERTESGLIRVTVTLPGSPRLRHLRDLWNSEGAIQRDKQIRELVARVANGYVDELRRYTREANLDWARRSRRFIEKRAAQVKVDLLKAEAQLERFRKENRTVAPQEEFKSQIQTITQLSAKKLDAEADLQGTMAQIEEVQRRIQMQAEKPLELPVTNPFIDTWRKDLIELESELALASQDMAEEHPEIIKLKARIAEKKNLIDGEVRRILASVKSGLAPDLATLESHRIFAEVSLAALSKALSQYENQLERLPVQIKTLTELEREAKIQETLYSTLMAELQNARIEEERESVQFEVLDQAVPPQKKCSPRLLKNLALAAFLSFFVACLIAFLRSVPTPSEAGKDGAIL